MIAVRRLLLSGFVVAMFSLAALAASVVSEWKVPPRKARIRNPVTADEASLAKGETIYAKECLSCHGLSGRGDGKKAGDLEQKVPDLNDPKIKSQTDGALFYKITLGRRPMPSYATLLTDEERWQVVNFLRAIIAPVKGK